MSQTPSHARNTASALVRKRTACEILGGISAPTLDRWVKAGRLARYKLGSNTSAYRLSDLEAFVDSALQPTAPNAACDQGGTQAGTNPTPMQPQEAVSHRTEATRGEQGGSK